MSEVKLIQEKIQVCNEFEDQNLSLQEDENIGDQMTIEGNCNSLPKMKTFHINSKVFSQYQRNLLDIENQREQSLILQEKGFFDQVLDFLNLEDLLILSIVQKKWPLKIKKVIKERILELLDQNLLEFLCIHLNMKENKKIFEACLNQVSNQADIIQKDLGRTFGGDEDEGLEIEARKYKLQEILIAISNYNTKIEYIQGWNLIVGGMIKLGLNKEMIFAYFNLLMSQQNYEKVYENDFHFCKILDFCAQVYLKKENKSLWQKLKKLELNYSYITMQWYCTFFAIDLPLECLTFIWNLFLLQKWKVIVKTTISLFLIYQQEIESLDESDEDSLNTFLKNFLQDYFIHDQQKQKLFYIQYNKLKITNSQISILQEIFENQTQNIDDVMFINNHFSNHNKIIWVNKQANVNQQIQAFLYKPHQLFQKSQILIKKKIFKQQQQQNNQGLINQKIDKSQEFGDRNQDLNFNKILSEIFPQSEINDEMNNLNINSSLIFNKDYSSEFSFFNSDFITSSENKQIEKDKNLNEEKNIENQSIKSQSHQSDNNNLSETKNLSKTSSSSIDILNLIQLQKNESFQEIGNQEIISKQQQLDKNNSFENNVKNRLFFSKSLEVHNLENKNSQQNQKPSSSSNLNELQKQNDCNQYQAPNMKKDEHISDFIIISSKK